MRVITEVQRYTTEKVRPCPPESVLGAAEAVALVQRYTEVLEAGTSESLVREMPAEVRDVYARIAGIRQGLTLIHLSAQPKHFLLDELVGFSDTKSSEAGAYVELTSGLV